MVGNLPEDFLRVNPPSNGSASPSSGSTSPTQAYQYQNTPNNAASQITLCIVQVMYLCNFHIHQHGNLCLLFEFLFLGSKILLINHKNYITNFLKCC